MYNPSDNSWKANHQMIDKVFNNVSSPPQPQEVVEASFIYLKKSDKMYIRYKVITVIRYNIIEC